MPRMFPSPVHRVACPLLASPEPWISAFSDLCRHQGPLSHVRGQFPKVFPTSPLGLCLVHTLQLCGCTSDTALVPCWRGVVGSSQKSMCSIGQAHSEPFPSPIFLKEKMRQACEQRSALGVEIMSIFFSWFSQNCLE